MSKSIITTTTTSSKRSGGIRTGGSMYGSGMSSGLNRLGSGGSFQTSRRAQSVVLGPTQRLSTSRFSTGSRMSNIGYSGALGGGRISAIGGGSSRMGLGGMGISSQGLIQRTAALDLNAPLPQIDTTQNIVRLQESQQLQGLNNQFVDFLTKVRHLEQVNTQLSIKLKLLQDQGEYKSNIESMFQSYIDNLKNQLDTLRKEKERFDAELLQMQGLVEDYKSRYEDEINKRTEMENEFVLVKKDVDDSYMSKVELEAKLEALTDEIEFLRSIYEEELRELQAQIQNTCVNVQLEGGPRFNAQEILDMARKQYEACAQQGREDAEVWKRTKMQELSMAAGQSGDDISVLKSEIRQTTEQIRRMNGDIDNLKKERVRLEEAIREAEDRGDMSLKDCKLQISKLEDAICKAQHELSAQCKEYEHLMGIKLALDIEINTYMKILDTEETRMATGVKTLNIQQVQSQGGMQQSMGLGSGSSAFQTSLSLGMSDRPMSSGQTSYQVTSTGLSQQGFI
ncbi:keratin, type II cytoskeletal 8-like [Hemiscyllium ocellatum]|uniref:keratin, type II cytoskeletal 8-like n=1 Tax=Hemiscyllium ocellatum TaxID=170820 RepID=UPI0029662B25|nr:keratin, type II cytoskeletal 8-like [Hemiscyllium ocellatum]